MLDRDRHSYSLAGHLLATDWNATALKLALRTADPPLGIPGLVLRILTIFPARPNFSKLSALLRSDAGISRAITRFEQKPRTLSQLLRARTNPPTPPQLAALNLPKFPTETALAQWFAIKPGTLQWLADTTGRNRRQPPGPLRTYRYRWIPRKNGPPRLLEIPKSTLKLLQRKILTGILNLIPLHPAAHGFRAGRSIVTNAAAHCGKPTVLRFDITDFFPGISAARIQRIFRTLGYRERCARLLAGICTTLLPTAVWDARPAADPRDHVADFHRRQRLISRHLPQGAPSSPALANLAAARLDRRLSALARTMNAAYTRYADDLTFSGDTDLARARPRLAPLIAAIAFDEGFHLNFRKTRILRGGARQHVTGVVVNVRPNIPRKDFDCLKAILTNCLRHGPASQNRIRHPDFQSYLAGKIAHLHSIHPVRARKLRTIFQQIPWT